MWIQRVVPSVLLFVALSGPASAQEPGSGDDLDFAELDLEQLLAIPIVESATKRKQSWFEAPLTVTVITADEIDASSAVNVPELLRRIEGVHVLQTHARSYSVSTRDLVRFQNNRVLILVDGRPAVDHVSGAQAWASLPVQIGDIERIEVIRGAGSTVYGANAFNGVINIVTRRAIDHPGLQGSAWGQLSLLSELAPKDASDPWIQGGGDVHLANSWVNSVKTLGFRLSGGISQLPEWPGGAELPAVNGPHRYSLVASLDYRPGIDWTVFLGLYHGMVEYATVTDTAAAPLENVVSAIYGSFALQLQKRCFLVDSLTLRIETSGGYGTGRFVIPEVLFAGEDLSSKISGEQTTADAHLLTALDWSIFDGRNILTVGGELALASLEGSTVSNPLYLFMGLYFQNETRLLSDESLVISLGGRLEQIQIEEDFYGQVIHRHFDPRATILWLPAQNHSLRLSVATANRTPTAFEALAYSPFIEEPPLPPVHSFVGNPDLKSERVLLMELGYRGLLFNSLRMEAVLFAKETEDPIGHVRESMMPVYSDNLGTIRQMGVELGLRFNPTRDVKAYLNYGLTLSWDADSGDRIGERPTHVYGLGVEARLLEDTRANLDGYLVFDYRPVLPVSHNQESGYPYTTWDELQAADQALIDLRLGHFLMKGRIEAFIKVSNLLGFFREPDGLRMMPLQVARPLGGALMLGLQLR